MLAATHRQCHVARSQSSAGQFKLRCAAPAHGGRSVAVCAQLHASAAQVDGADVQLARRQLLQSAVLLTLGSATSPAALAAEPIETVFVAGATGNTGRRVVQQLRAAGFKVKAGVRDPRKAQSLGFGLDSGISLEVVDVTKSADSLIPAISGAQAVICATGYNGFNPGAVASVDETGTIHLVDAAKAAGVSNFVLLSSLLTNAPAVGQQENPNYKFLNLFGGVLDHKLAAEQYLRGSGLTWTVVRAGGLSNDGPEKVGKLIVGKEDTLFGLDNEPGREISRDTVASVLVAALQQAAAANKVVEVVASPSAADLPPEQWFAV